MSARGLVLLLIWLGIPLFGWTYAVSTTSSVGYVKTPWFAAIEPVTNVVAAAIPGVGKTGRELEALGYPDRARLVKHNLAVIWLCGIGGWVASLWVAAQLPPVNPVQVHEKHQEKSRQLLDMSGSRLLVVMFIGLAVTVWIPFIGGASNTGRRLSWDFVREPDGYFPFVFWSWLFCLFALGLFAMGRIGLRRIRDS
jgi:hypothetical protein